MPTRLQIVTEAARRLGDQSTDFLTELDATFDFVMRDLALYEAIPNLRRTATFTVTASVTTYNTQTITSLGAPNFPWYIERLRVPFWDARAIQKAETEDDFEHFKALMANSEGRWQRWRIYPNEQTLEVTPAANADNAGGSNIAQVLYYAPHAVITSGTAIGELRDETEETLVFGIMARGAEHKEETMQAAQGYWALYLANRAQLYKRAHNHRGGRINVTEF